MHGVGPFQRPSGNGSRAPKGPDSVPAARILFRPTLTATTYRTASGPARPFPLQSPGCELFVRGRHALYAGVSRIGLEPGDEILVPAYHHGAEIEALIRAGLSVVYYGAMPDLAPDPQELADLLTPRCRALMVTHVLGFPQDGASWRTWCDERGLALIENAADAWSATVDGQPVGSFGDLAIFCPAKTLPLPPVSVLVLRSPSGDAVAPEAGDFRRSGPPNAPWVLGRDLLPLLGARAKPATATDLDMSLGDPTQRPSRLAAHLLHRLTEDPAGIRRENYRLLLEQLGDVVPGPFTVVPEGASPLGFPVEVPDKAAVLERLASRGIDCVDVWPRAHSSLPADSGGTAAHRRRSTVALPVHQGLRVDDLERIVDAVRPSRPRPDELRAEAVEDFECLRSEWSDLAVHTRNIFATWEWNRTWWEYIGQGRPLALTTLRDAQGSLRAILPLYLWRERPLRIARFIGHLAGDQLQPICAPSDVPAVSRSIRELLREGRWDLLMGERLPSPDAWGKRLSGRTLRRENSPVLFLKGSWDEATRPWSPRFRSQLRRHERRLRAERDVRVTAVDDRRDLEAGLDIFFDLHRTRWTNGTKFEQREPFHREFARRAFDNGWLRLQITEADGVPVAGILNFRYCGVEFGYQSGWRPEYADYSVGTFQLMEAIRSAHADGIQEYRFLRGGESYKYRFAQADAGLETVIARRPSLPGAVAATGVALADSALPRHFRQKGKSGA
jgi:CelD/BcsL family acetyltransferase involved in cellulose biosynthesis